jgi:hypothetical protein
MTLQSTEFMNYRLVLSYTGIQGVENMWTRPSTALLVDISALVDEYCLRALLQSCTKLVPKAYASFQKFMVNKVTATGHR